MILELRIETTRFGVDEAIATPPTLGGGIRFVLSSALENGPFLSRESLVVGGGFEGIGSRPRVRGWVHRPVPILASIVCSFSVWDDDDVSRTKPGDIVRAMFLGSEASTVQSRLTDAWSFPNNKDFLS